MSIYFGKYGRLGALVCHSYIIKSFHPGQARSWTEAWCGWVWAYHFGSNWHHGWIIFGMSICSGKVTIDWPCFTRNL